MAADRHRIFARMTDQPSEALTAADHYFRGAVGMGLTWAVGGSVILPLLDVFEWVFEGGGAPQILLAIPLGAILGFFNGGVFSVLLAVAGRRRRFDELSLPRFAVLGALVPLFMMVTIAVFVGGIGGLFTPGALRFATVLALIGAGFAAGTLALARKAEDRELLDAGTDVADVGLTKQERHELLGK